MEKNRRALIIVDVQNDFCPGGALAVAQGDEVVAPLNELAQEFLANGDLVVKTRDWHKPTTKHFADFGGVWPVHCVQNTHGAEFHPQLIDHPAIHIIAKGLGDKDCYSGFDETGLAAFLRNQQVSELWIGGLATDYCVKNTVLDALQENFRVKLLTFACRAVELNPGDGEAAIDEMKAAGATLE